MFQTLAVSQPVIRVDRRAGLTALFLHVIVIGLAAQLRPRLSHSPSRTSCPRFGRRWLASGSLRRGGQAARLRCGCDSGSCSKYGDAQRN